MILYHGTNADFGEIDLRKSNRNNASSEPAHDYDIVIGPIANDLYHQSPGYVYSFLQNELKTAKVS